MSNFIIDLPYQKRWWLPDRIHQYNSIILGDYLYISVIHAPSGHVVLSVPAIKLAGNWEETAEIAQELAKKRFRSQRIKDSIPEVLAGPKRN